MYKTKITTSKQFEILVGEMEKNPALAKGFSKTQVPSNSKSEWEAITKKLNISGPPVRDTDGWQRVWKDLKFKTKKKLVHNKSEAKSTGGGIFKQMTLSPLEEAVANLMQFEKLLNPPGHVLGVEETMVEETGRIDSAEDNEPTDTSFKIIESTVEAPRTSRTNAGKKSLGKDLLMQLLNEQHKVLLEHNDESLKILANINSILKEGVRLKRKRFQMEEERHKMLKEQYQKDEDDRELERRIKKRKLDLLDMQLAALQNE